MPSFKATIASILYFKIFAERLLCAGTEMELNKTAQGYFLMVYIL